MNWTHIVTEVKLKEEYQTLNLLVQVDAETIPWRSWIWLKGEIQQFDVDTHLDDALLIVGQSWPYLGGVPVFNLTDLIYYSTSSSFC